MAERDYYEVLNVPRNATPDQIKSAYRKLAKKFHPDRNRGDKSSETRFKEVQQAYEVLNDPAQRKAYDQFGHAGPRGGAGPGSGFGGFRPGAGGQRVYTWGPRGGRGGAGGGGGDVPIEGLEDLFSIFGGRAGAEEGLGGFEEFIGRASGRKGGGARRRRQPPPDRDENLNIEQEVSLTFDQAIQGTKLELQLRHPDGEAQQVTVRIPPGVDDGQRIRVRGKGQPNPTGGSPGDLHIVCRVQPHPYFKRVGNDIHLELPLTVSEALLGTKVEIPTLEGRTVLTIPPGTPSGAKLRLKDKGVAPPGDKPRGHQFVVIRIVPPKTLTPEQQELVQRFRDLGEGSPREGLGW